MIRQRLFWLAAVAAVAIATLALARIGVVAQDETPTASEPWMEATPILRLPETTPLPTRPPAPAQAQAQGPILFQDTFDTTASIDQWTAVDLIELTPLDKPAQWMVNDGVMRQVATGADAAWRPEGTLAAAGDAGWRDYVFQADIYPKRNSEIGLVFHRQDKSFYRIRMLPQVSQAKQKILLERVVDGQATVLDAHAGPGYDYFRWHSFRVSLNGPHIEVHIDDLPPLAAEDDALPAGQIGLYTLALGDVVFDNVVVVQQ